MSPSKPFFYFLVIIFCLSHRASLGVLMPVGHQELGQRLSLDVERARERIIGDWKTRSLGLRTSGSCL